MRQVFLKIASDRRLAIGFLALLSSLFFIGLGRVHLFDWDEINFAESAREMIVSGDYLKVQINFLPFWEKPPLFFWLQVISMKIFGINEFSARFPNAFFGLIYLITFYFIGRKHFSERFGLLWAILFFGTLLPHVYFKSGIIDPVFNYFIFMSVYFMMSGVESKHTDRYMFLSGLFSGLSVLTKGPVGLLLVGLTTLVYLLSKRFKSFFTFRQILLFLAGLLIAVGSWLAVEFHQNGTENMLKFVKYMVELFTSGVAGHEQPFYYHFIVVFLGCFPISILALPFLFTFKVQTPKNFHRWMQALFWVVLILFSMTTTKIVHYSSMTYIPLSFLATLYVYDVFNGRRSLKSFQKVLLLSFGLLWGLIFTVIPLIMKNKEKLYPYIKDPFAVEAMKTPIAWSNYEMFIGLFFIAMVIASWLLIRRRKVLQGCMVLSLSAGIALLCISFIILPKIESFSQGTAIRFFESIAGKDAYVTTYGYKSYAQYFYAAQPCGLSDKRNDTQWLLSGKIDKPVYFVSKVTNRELDAYPDITFLKSEGGFRFYVRRP